MLIDSVVNRSKERQACLLWNKSLLVLTELKTFFKLAHLWNYDSRNMSKLARHMIYGTGIFANWKLSGGIFSLCTSVFQVRKRQLRGQKMSLTCDNQFILLFFCYLSPLLNTCTFVCSCLSTYWVQNCSRIKWNLMEFVHEPKICTVRFKKRILRWSSLDTNNLNRS